MNETLSFALTFALALACVTGALLGAIFFGGLWWTVRKGVASKRPVLWFFGSYLARTSAVVGGFYYFLADDWMKLAAGLVGFMLARVVITRLTRPAPDQVAREAGHAT